MWACLLLGEALGVSYFRHKGLSLENNLHKGPETVYILVMGCMVQPESGKKIMRLNTFWHSVFGFVTLPRYVSRDYNEAQLQAAIELVLQSGE